MSAHLPKNGDLVWVDGKPGVVQVIDYSGWWVWYVISHLDGTKSMRELQDLEFGSDEEVST